MAAAATSFCSSPCSLQQHRIHRIDRFVSHYSLSTGINTCSLTSHNNIKIAEANSGITNHKPFQVPPPSGKWGAAISFFNSFTTKSKESLKEELLEAIAPLDRGAAATSKDQDRIDQIARKLEAVNRVREPLESNLLNGKWELLYTTSKSILQTQRPKLLRPNGKIYQALNVDTLRAQNLETWPFFNQATANLVPLSATRVAVKFDSFKIAGLIPIKSRGSGRGQLEITYLDEDLRISRGNQGNLFILRMVDPSYRVPS